MCISLSLYLSSVCEGSMGMLFSKYSSEEVTVSEEGVHSQSVFLHQDGIDYKKLSVILRVTVSLPDAWTIYTQKYKTVFLGNTLRQALLLSYRGSRSIFSILNFNNNHNITHRWHMGVSWIKNMLLPHYIMVDASNSPQCRYCGEDTKQSCEIYLDIFYLHNIVMHFIIL